MPGLVRCPVCGLDNDRDNVLRYRMCSHCGAQMEAGPEASAAAAMPGQAPSGAAPPQAAGAPPPPPPPQYGAPPASPPPYGAYPPQQPYPPPPYPGAPYPPPPYGYGAPYGMPWPPTFHPGVYERPEEPPRYDLGALFTVLFRPKAAFEELYHHTGMSQGIVMAVVLIVLSGIMGLLLTMAILSGVDVPSDASTSPVPLGQAATTAASAIGNIVVSIVTFLVATYLVFALLKGAGHARRPDLGKTFGLVGYAKFPAFIMGFAISIVSGIMLSSVDWSTMQNPEDATAVMGTVCGLAAVILVFAVIMFAWGLWVHSHAASVANDVSLGTAAGFTFLAWFIAFIVMIALSAVVGVLTTF